MAITMLVPFVIVAVVFLLIIGVKADPGNGGESMIKNVYIYLVLFATLMMTIGGSVAAFMATADMVAPVAYHQSFEEYKRWGMEKSPVGNEEVKLSEAELKARYDAMVAAEKERQVDRAKNSLIKSLGWIVIPFPIAVSR